MVTISIIYKLCMCHLASWVIISTQGCNNGEVELFDSLQRRPSVETQKGHRKIPQI